MAFKPNKTATKLNVKTYTN